MADFVLQGGQAHAFLNKLLNQADAWQNAADQWPQIGKFVEDYVVGASPSGISSLDLIMKALDDWHGSAADEFRDKAGAVRLFGLEVAALATSQVTLDIFGSQIPASERWRVTTQDRYFARTAQTIAGLLRDAHARYTDIIAKYDKWTTYLAGLVLYLDAHRSQYTIQVPTFDEYLGGARAWDSRAGASAYPIPTGDDPDITDPDGTSQGWNPGKGTATLTIDANSGGFGPFMFHYRSDVAWFDYPFSFPLGDQGFGDHKKSIYLLLQGKDEEGHQQPGELWSQARKVVQELGAQYQMVTLPQKADDSQLPKGNGSGSNNGSGGGYGGGGLGGGFGPGSGLGGYDPGAGGLDGYDPGVYDPGAYDPGATDPGSYDPGAYDPGSYDPGSYDPGAYDPSGTLADAGLGGGSGLYTPGAGSGFGGFDPNGGLGGGGLDGSGPGTGAGGAAGATQGAAGRNGFPMTPGYGAGGKDNKERQRQSWLPEDDDVWGAAVDAPGPVL